MIGGLSDHCRLGIDGLSIGDWMIGDWGLGIGKLSTPELDLIHRGGTRHANEIGAATMNWRELMRRITTKISGTCAALLLGATLSYAQGPDASRTTVITFSAPVSLPGVT